MADLCPLRLAEDAALLLKSGRLRMAESVLAQLPAAIEAAMRQVAGFQYLQGRADAERLRR
jgi:hypothetical protein